MIDAAGVREFCRPFFYSDPFWSDPTDPATDATCLAAVEQFAIWQPVRQRNNRIAIGIYVALWLVDIALIVKWFSWPDNGNGAEPVAVPAGVLFIALLSVVPWLLVMYAGVASKHTTAATNAISTSSYQRYAAWLSWLQDTDMATYAQIALWHQGEQARRLQTAQLALQAYNTYQLHDVRRELRNDND